MAHGESNGHVTLKSHGRDPNMLVAQYLEHGLNWTFNYNENCVLQYIKSTSN